LNLHGLPRYHLKVVRLPISPPGLEVKQYMRSLRGVEGRGLSSPGRISALLPHLLSFKTGATMCQMALSARNQFPGKIVSVRRGGVMSEIIIDIGGGNQIVSLISTSSAKRLKLKKGGRAVAVIKATEVIISTDRSAGEEK
jgi:molybdopterin-binding protein